MTRALRRAVLALALLLTSAAVPTLGATPATAADAPPVSIVGTYERLAKDVFDSHGDLTHVYSDVLRVPGRSYPLRLSAGHGLTSGTKIRVSAPAGYTTGALAPTTVTKLAPASTIGSAGTSSVLVILAYWGAKDTMTQAKATAQIFGDDDKWFREASYGRAGLAGVVTPWLRIEPPHNLECYNYAEQLRYDAEQKARELGQKYDPQNFQRTIIYFPRCGGYDTKNVAGWAYEPGNIVWLNGVMDRRTSIHELGHSYGLGHARSYVCKSASGTPVTLSGSCRSSEYGDPYDAMGRTSYVAHFSGYRKDKLGWLGSRKRVLRTASSTFTLPPFERPSTLPVVVVANSARVVTRSYWLEYRRPTGMDARLPAGATGGVLVHLKDTARPGWLLDATPRDRSMATAVLKPGTSWTAPDYVKISVGAVTSTGIRVTVTGARPAPVAPSAPRVTATAGDGRIDVSWTPPASDGGAAIQSYRLLLTSTSGNHGPYVLLATERSVPVGGLRNGATYTVSVRATNAAGTGPAGIATGTPKSLGPNVSLVAPVAGATIAGQYTFKATATPHAETKTPVQCVEFVVDGAPRTSTCNRDEDGLWSAVWTTSSIPNGYHDVEVYATDGYGRANSAGPVRVRFANPIPEVAITSPKDGVTVDAETITLTSTATVPYDAGATIVRVEYHDVTYGWQNYLGESRAAPFSFAWGVTHAAGTRRVVAVAVASNGHRTTSAPVQVTIVHPPPTVTITSPGRGLVSGTSVPVTANAVVTAAGQSVARVEFYASGVHIGSDATAPYGITWDTRSFRGSASLAAEIFETSGRMGRSAVVSVTVDNPVPVLLHSTPGWHASVTPSALAFAGTATAPAAGRPAPTHVTVTVGGTTRETPVGADGAWSLPWPGLAYGHYEAYVTAHTPGGYSSPVVRPYFSVVRPTPSLSVATPLPNVLVQSGTSAEFVLAAAPGPTDPATITRVCVSLGYYGTQYCAAAPGEDGKYRIPWTAPPHPDSGSSYVRLTMDDGYVHALFGPSIRVARAPAPPRITEVRPADGALTVYFTPSYEYQPISPTSYDLTVGDVTKTVTGTMPVTFDGLTNLQSYAVSIRATNEIGTGAAATTTAVPGIATRFVLGTYPSQVGYDTTMTVAATLQETYTGNALAGRAVTLARCPTRSSCVTEATGTTGADGAVTLSTPLRASGSYQVRYDGDGVAELPAAGPNWYVVVVPRAVLAFSTTEPIAGETVRATATVAPGTSAVDVVLQRSLVSNPWNVYYTAPSATDETHVYFDVSLPAGTYTFRVRMYARETERYVYSDPVTLTVAAPA